MSILLSSLSIEFLKIQTTIFNFQNIVMFFDCSFFIAAYSCFMDATSSYLCKNMNSK